MVIDCEEVQNSVNGFRKYVKYWYEWEDEAFTWQFPLGALARDQTLKPLISWIKDMIFHYAALSI